MQIQRQLRTTCGLALSLAMVSSLGLTAIAQEATVQGMVIGRNGPQMAVKTADTPRLIVLLSDSTKATQKGGFLGMGGRDLGVEALVPGLSVKVEGAYNPDHQLLAKKVVFSKGSLNTARAIDAGLDPVNAKLGEQQDQLASNKRDISQSQDMIAKNSQDIDATKQGLATTTQATTQNTTQIGQTNTRIGTLDQYDTKDSMTINFANGKATVKPQDKDALTDFVKAAANTPGFMIEVQGYASTVGSATLNQRLSAERADAVLAIIQQSGAVPMTRILAPAAMGTSNQVDTDHTRKAQAQNRRVVVTIVVNKGIVGSTGS
ncbi:OmpA family protein [Granulicella sp. L46]|jgi:OOP family OmpA-OmpF porin|uniref:OmpA family protein n=1 Tax=Granulicella sp. L46 TaxID=1641865 RepID=UPI001C2032D2|nr:OmpA family protein [Granulicella sp. L46]